MSRLPWRRKADHRPPTDAGGARPVELPLGRCYVAVGGYGTVDILLRHGGKAAGPAAVIGLPLYVGTGLAECVVQTGDHIIIRNDDGLIAELPVQRIVDEGSFAGFQRLDRDASAAAVADLDPQQSFEHFLAGVSARALRARERAERQLAPIDDANSAEPPPS